ncbi:MAG TPA: zf-HC2 domain-containing protein [Bryobacteraceae bacterium]
MCEYENRLIAWIDGELVAIDSLQVELHLQACEICRDKVCDYREVSRAFAAFHAAPPIGRNRVRPAWAAAGALAIAATAAAMLWMVQTPVQQLPFPAPKIALPPAIAFETRPPDSAVQAKAAPHETVAKQTVARHNEIRPQPAWSNMEPFVEIAIPADAIFAPGAMPAGFTFAADLGIAGDGSPGVLRVQPGIYVK